MFDRVNLILMARLAVVMTVLSLICPDAVRAAELISWEVINRHRVLEGPQEEATFRRELDLYKICASAKDRRTNRKCKIGWALSPEILPSLRNCSAGILECNYATKFVGASNRYRDLHSQERSISVKLNAPAKKNSCSWKIDSKDIPGADCAISTLTTNLGKHELFVRYTPAVGGAPVNSGPLPIEIKDVLVLVLGDSYVSGEGNPHVTQAHPYPSTDGATALPARRPEWWDLRCHRSLLSGPALAAAEYAARHRHLSVTFVSFACSGAEVTEGVLQKYSGRETKGQALELLNVYGSGYAQLPISVSNAVFIPPQIVAARDALCLDPDRTNANAPCTKSRKADIVVLGVGVNDVGFGDIVRDFSFKDNVTSKYAKVLSDKMSDLKQRFVDLGPQLNDLVDAPKPNARRSILALEYLDPTHDENGNACSDQLKPRERRSFNAKVDKVRAKWGKTEPAWRPFVPKLAAIIGFGINGLENEFAYNKLLKPLNLQISAAADQNAWQYVGGIAAMSRRKGYCAKTTWFHSYSDSFEKQYIIALENDPVKNVMVGGVPTGAMHPNIFGHSAVAERLGAAFDRALKDK